MKALFLALLYLAVAMVAMSAVNDAITPRPLHKYTDPGYCGASRIMRPHLKAGSAPRTYPPQAVRQNEEGATIVDFRIEKDGKVDDVQIIRSSGFTDLDQAAQSATRTERYYPAMLAAKPIACRRIERVVWKLTDGDDNKAPSPSSYVNVYNMGRADYPPQAAANGEQGTTKVEVAIDETGKIIQSQVSQSSGFNDLDLAALNRVYSRKQLTTARLSGKPIRTVALFEFRWSLASRRGEPDAPTHP